MAATRPAFPTVISPRQAVFVLRKAGTYFGVHPLSPVLHTPQTFVAVFVEESNARAWANGLNAYEMLTNRPPVRDYERMPCRFAWMTRTPARVRGGAVSVQQVAFRDLLAQLAGRNIKCRVFLDAGDISRVLDVRPTFDDANVRAQMEADFGRCDGSV